MNHRAKNNSLATVTATELIEQDVQSSPELVGHAAKLCLFDELEPWQQDNHYLISGYVRLTGSVRGCVASLAYLHNESVNIYSHLLPGLSTLWYVHHYVATKLEIYPTYFGWERFNLMMFAMAATTCFAMSASFHTMKSHSHDVYRSCNQLDYFGIVVMICVSLISIVLFAFHDHQGWVLVFTATFVALALVCTVVTLDPQFRLPKYRPFRSMMFLVFGLSGIFPIVVSIQVYGYTEAIARTHAWWLLAEGGLYLGGAAIYALRLPERWGCHSHRQGTFDYFGHSHQIFHVMVVIAAYCHWRSLLGAYSYLHENLVTGVTA